MPAGERFSAEDLEDVASAAAPDAQSTQQRPPSQKPNAFTELMKPKSPKATPRTAEDRQTQRTVFMGRDGLAAYTRDPASFPSSRVVYYNDKFVVINDLYPKAAVHLLLLPRDPKKNVLRPQVAFDDPVFLEECREEEKKVRAIVISELRRRFGTESKQEQPRRLAMEADEPSDEPLPPGRDWNREIISGIHAIPSMAHLHIHVLSRDMNSECMKKSNHYLSFQTDFLVGLQDFPLAMTDPRRDYSHLPSPDLICWRCGQNFGRKMARLKEHLQEEFDEWRRE